MNKICLYVLVLLCVGCGWSYQGGKPGRLKPSSTVLLNAGATLTVTEPLMMVGGNGGAVTLGSAGVSPAVAAGVAIGQQVIIMGTSDANTVTIPDEATSDKSLVETVADASVVLGQNDTLCLLWTGTRWIMTQAQQTINADD